MGLAWGGEFDDATWSRLCAAVSASRRGLVRAEAPDAPLLAAAASIGVRELVAAGYANHQAAPAAEVQRMRLLRTTAVVHHALRHAAIAHAFFKGVLADAIVYGGRGLRESQDVDVLVASEAASEARRILCKLGFFPVDNTDAPVTARFAKAESYTTDDPSLAPVDLHVRPLNAPAFRSRASDVLTELRLWPTPLGPLPGPAPEVALPWIAGNLAGGRFQGLLRLAADAAGYMALGALDTDALVRRAAAWRAGAATWGLLRLLTHRFDVAVSPAVLGALQPSRAFADRVDAAFGVQAAPFAPTSKMAAVIHVDWPVAGRLRWLPERAAYRLVFGVADRCASLALRAKALGPLERARANTQGVRAAKRAPWSPPMLTAQSKVKVPPDVLVQEIEGEAVLLDLRAEKYFGLDESGTFLFRALERTGTFAGALAAGLAHFDVEEGVLRADLTELIENLARENLVTVE